MDETEQVLSFGGLSFRIRADREISAEEAASPFFTLPPGQRGEEVLVSICADGGQQTCTAELSSRADRVTIRYSPKISGEFGSLRGCLTRIPMERLLLAHNRFFLHASFVTSQWGGLLFTGNSGVGKSTQAELWKEHMGSTVVNGDRAILAREPSGWYAYGSPYSGSSHYYVQRREPVRAILLLEQARENRVSPVSPGTAFRKLLLQISADHRKAGEMNRLCDLVTELIETVPVYRLSCTPDVRAVNTLRAALEKGGIGCRQRADR